jgi:hypothetical protein
MGTKYGFLWFRQKDASRRNIALFRTAVQKGAADPVGAVQVEAAVGQGTDRIGI